MIAPQRALLPGGRWHFQHGPIDLVIGIEGASAAVAKAIDRGWDRFQTILAELVAELLVLRRDVRELESAPVGPTAGRMWTAVSRHRNTFITPMAAVAGAVADEILARLANPDIARAFVNNGGDIALYLSPGTSWTIGIFGDLSRFDPVCTTTNLPLEGKAMIGCADSIRGVATSGWQGRSYSLGIADSVTVLAADGASADAAATIIANAVNIDHPGIVREPACALSPESDLGDRLVTRHVPPLPPALVDAALSRGRARAENLIRRRIVHQVYLQLQGRACVAGHAIPLSADRIPIEARQ